MSTPVAVTELAPVAVQPLEVLGPVNDAMGALQSYHMFSIAPNPYDADASGNHPYIDYTDTNYTAPPKWHIYTLRVDSSTGQPTLATEQIDLSELDGWSRVIHYQNGTPSVAKWDHYSNHAGSLFAIDPLSFSDGALVGEGTLQGVAAERYLFTYAYDPKGQRRYFEGTMDIWLAKETHYVLLMHRQGKSYASLPDLPTPTAGYYSYDVEVEYSRFNDPSISITAPTR